MRTELAPPRDPTAPLETPEPCFSSATFTRPLQSTTRGLAMTSRASSFSESPSASNLKMSTLGFEVFFASADDAFVSTLPSTSLFFLPPSSSSSRPSSSPSFSFSKVICKGAPSSPSSSEPKTHTIVCDRGCSAPLVSPSPPADVAIEDGSEGVADLGVSSDPDTRAENSSSSTQEEREELTGLLLDSSLNTVCPPLPFPPPVSSSPAVM